MKYSRQERIIRYGRFIRGVPSMLIATYTCGFACGNAMGFPGSVNPLVETLIDIGRRF